MPGVFEAVWPRVKTRYTALTPEHRCPLTSRITMKCLCVTDQQRSPVEAEAIRIANAALRQSWLQSKNAGRGEGDDNEPVPVGDYGRTTLRPELRDCGHDVVVDDICSSLPNLVCPVCWHTYAVDDVGTGQHSFDHVGCTHCVDDNWEKIGLVPLPPGFSAENHSPPYLCACFEMARRTIKLRKSNGTSYRDAVRLIERTIRRNASDFFIGERPMRTGVDDNRILPVLVSCVQTSV